MHCVCCLWTRWIAKDARFNREFAFLNNKKTKYSRFFSPCSPQKNPHWLACDPERTRHYHQRQKFQWARWIAKEAFDWIVSLRFLTTTKKQSTLRFLVHVHLKKPILLGMWSRTCTSLLPMAKVSNFEAAKDANVCAFTRKNEKFI